MKNLLKADFYRIFKQKLIYLIIIVSCLAGIAIPLLYKLMNKMMSFDCYSVKDILANSFSTTCIVALVIPIFTAIIIYQDYSSGIIRNKILAGYTRTKIFLSNFIINLVITVGAILTTVLLACLLGSILLPFSVDNYAIDKEIEEVVFCILINLAIIVYTCSITSLFATGLRNLALAIIIPYAFVNLASILSAICTLSIYFEDKESLIKLFEAIELINIYGGRDYVLTYNMISAFSVNYPNDTYCIYDAYHIVAYTFIPLGLACLNVFLGILGLKNKDLK